MNDRYWILAWQYTEKTVYLDIQYCKMFIYITDRIRHIEYWNYNFTHDVLKCVVLCVCVSSS